MEDELFYTCSNNGITAVITADTMAAIEKYQEVARTVVTSRDEDIESLLGLYPTPIFTFGPAEQVLTFHPYLTGTHQAMNLLLSGHHTREGSFYVPFSNGFELSGSREQVMAELRFATPLDVVTATFGPEAMERLSRMPLPTVDLAVI